MTRQSRKRYVDRAAKRARRRAGRAEIARAALELIDFMHENKKREHAGVLAAIGELPKREISGKLAIFPVKTTREERARMRTCP